MKPAKSNSKQRLSTNILLILLITVALEVYFVFTSVIAFSAGTSGLFQYTQLRNLVPYNNYIKLLSTTDIGRSAVSFDLAKSTSNICGELCELQHVPLRQLSPYGVSNPITEPQASIDDFHHTPTAIVYSATYGTAMNWLQGAEIYIALAPGSVVTYKWSVTYHHLRFAGLDFEIVVPYYINILYFVFTIGVNSIAVTLFYYVALSGASQRAAKIFAHHSLCPYCKFPYNTAPIESTTCTECGTTFIMAVRRTILRNTVFHATVSAIIVIGIYTTLAVTLYNYGFIDKQAMFMYFVTIPSLAGIASLLAVLLTLSGFNARCTPRTCIVFYVTILLFCFGVAYLSTYLRFTIVLSITATLLIIAGVKISHIFSFSK